MRVRENAPSFSEHIWYIVGENMGGFAGFCIYVVVWMSERSDKSMWLISKTIVVDNPKVCDIPSFCSKMAYYTLVLLCFARY
nr:MAG TPA: hypothetical protein [Caudoviricetes sp.]